MKRIVALALIFVVAMCQHIAAGMQSTRICNQMTRSQSYDMHGWLREWNTPFVSQQLRYADGANPSYSGRVSAKITGSYGRSDRYDYSYDRLGRLISADFSREMPPNVASKDGDADYSTTYSYDLQGNILSLTHQGMTAPGFYFCIDDIQATFNGNQLSSLSDDALTVLLESSLDLPRGSWSGDDFSYDANGNQTRDMSRSVTHISYNELNLPSRVEFASGGRIDYLYSATGTKLQEAVYDADGGEIVKREYVGAFEFENDTLVRISLAEGYITACDSTYHAYIPDYQGNIVGVYNTRTNTLEQRTDYYPYGLPHASISSEVARAEVNRRKFGGKELMSDHGYNSYDFAARHQNPAFPHFTTPDPLADIRRNISIYVFCSSDPINRIDPSGMADFYSEDEYLGSDGINDGRRFVLNTTKEFYNESQQENVPAAGLSETAAEKSISFIKSNNGNSEAFKNTPSIYDNFTEIESRPEVINGMAKVAELDDGNGGDKTENNQEHGGYIENGQFITEQSGEPTTPDKVSSVSISLYHGEGKMHTHPSGTKTKKHSAYDRKNNVIQSYETTHMYVQHPSLTDINNSGANINYVIGRRNNLVYIYNNKGIRAVIKYELFIK